MQMESVRILIADDHTLFRQGLKQVLELEPDLCVVGEVATGDEAVKQAVALHPDVVVLDVSMPGGGLEACATIKQKMPDMGVVILTMHDDQEYLLRALRAGANSYMVKDVDSSNLAAAIRAAKEGRPYMHPKLAGLALMEMTRTSHRERRGPDPTDLTEREVEVLRMVGQGASNREIAASLFISEKTAKNHLTHIFGKIGVSDRTQAALFAIRSGLVHLEKG